MVNFHIVFRWAIASDPWNNGHFRNRVLGGTKKKAYKYGLKFREYPQNWYGLKYGTNVQYLHQLDPEDLPAEWSDATAEWRLLNSAYLLRLDDLVKIGGQVPATSRARESNFGWKHQEILVIVCVYVYEYQYEYEYVYVYTNCRCYIVCIVQQLAGGSILKMRYGPQITMAIWKMMIYHWNKCSCTLFLDKPVYTCDIRCYVVSIV